MTATAVPDATVTIDAFNAAFNEHDVDAIMALMTPDCVFEGTMPPDGDRHEGAGAVRRAWESFFAASPDAHFITEEVVSAGSRVVVRWRYEWTNADSSRGHVRGIDLFRVEGGQVTEKLAYVKG